MAESSSQTPPERSKLPKWFKVTTLVLLVLANLAAIAFIWAVQTGNTLLGGADTDDEVTEVLDPASGDDLTFLVVGSDSREGLDDLTHFGAAGGARGDVVMLVRIAGNGSAQMLSVPRDYYVDIPGHGKNKINAAYSLGGPALMVETIKSNFDLRINHYVEIDFVGFQAMVDELGGIDIAFPFAARDLKSGLAVDAGAETLDGFQALAYARSRSYQELQNGSWVSVKANDFGRTERQQEVIRAMLSKLKRPGSITEAGDIASAMGRHMTIDTKLANASVASFIWDYRGILAGSIEGATLPGDIRTISGSSVVVAREPDASAMLANFRAGRPFASQPLRIEVLNGNGQAGAAGDMSRTLESYGFLVEAIGNAEDTYAETTVIVPEGSESGSVITAALGFGVVRFGSVDNGYDALVIVGSDVS